MLSSNFNSINIFNFLNLNDEDLINIALKHSSKKGDLTERILHWDFGPIMEMKYQQDAQNYLFSDEIVPLHWDGAFYKEPSHLLFYCTESLGEGGETIFSNTELVWNKLNNEEKKIAESITLKYATEKKAHYGGEISLSLVQKHPITNNIILRLAEEVETNLNPVSLEMNSLLDVDVKEFYRHLVNLFYSDEYSYVHQWKKGDLLVVDNFTYLHGRKALRNNLSRSFKRIQIL